MGVVTLVNIKILTSYNTQTFWSFFFSIGSIVTFIIEFYIVNLFPSDDVYLEFQYVYSHPYFYVALFFIGGALILIDNGLHLAQYEV